MKTLRIWDLGRKRNWSEVFGGGEWWDIIWWGGRPYVLYLLNESGKDDF
jgi:hypothetical protein